MSLTSAFIGRLMARNRRQPLLVHSKNTLSGVRIKRITYGRAVADRYLENNDLEINLLHHHFPGTRCLSSSNQFTTMLILGRGGAVAGFSAVAAGTPDGFIIRNFLLSGLMSHGVAVRFPKIVEEYFPLKRILGFPRLNVGSVSTSTAIVASPLR